MSEKNFTRTHIEHTKEKRTTEAAKDTGYRKRPPSAERGAQTSHVATTTTTTTNAPLAAHPMIRKLCTEQPHLFASPGVGNCDGTLHVSLPPLFATLATVRSNAKLFAACCCEGACPTERPQRAAAPTEMATDAPHSQSPFPAILLPSDPPEDASDSAQRLCTFSRPNCSLPALRLRGMPVPLCAWARVEAWVSARTQRCK